MTCESRYLKAAPFHAEPRAAGPIRGSRSDRGRVAAVPLRFRGRSQVKAHRMSLPCTVRNGRNDETH
jgi:hypothetical protein